VPGAEPPVYKIRTPLCGLPAVGKSQVPEAGYAYGLELHLFAPTQAGAHVELLTMAAYFYVRAEPLGWGIRSSSGGRGIRGQAAAMV
jgi:hypothetical protein